MAANGGGGANIGFENELWRAADALRSNMDAAEYKHVVLGLIFLKYISDAFEEQHAKLQADRAQGADPEDPDEYRAVNVFWVPPEARWQYLRGRGKDPKIGKIVDDAMLAIERDNPSLKGVLPKDYAHPRLDKERLGQLIDMIGNIGLGDKESRSKDVLGRVYEDVPGFCKSTTLDDIRGHGHILTPGRYVGAAEVEDDGEPFEDKMARLTAELKQQTEDAAKLDKLIWANLEDIGYGK